MNNINYKGAIFDLDGTLVDSMWIWETVIDRWLKNHQLTCGNDPADTIKTMTFYESACYIIDRLDLKMTPDEVASEWSDMILDDYRHRISLKSGVYEFVKQLKSKGVKLCIATSNFREACEAVLQSAKIDSCFDFIITSDEVGKNKSFPDIYLLAAKKMGLLPEECMVFEDILPAILSAKSAGFHTTGVYDAESSADTEAIKKQADNYIISFDELLDM